MLPFSRGVPYFDEEGELASKNILLIRLSPTNVVDR